MRKTFGRFVLNASLGLGLASVSFLNAYAAEPALAPPPSLPSVKPSCPYPIVPAPGGTLTPAPDGGAAPAAPGADAPIAATDAPAATGDTGAGGGVESVAMMGRSDFFNRFNIFDTQSAAPRNRVWFNFQRNEDFNPSATSGGSAAVVLDRPTTYLYRGGAEIAVSERASFSFQHQYIGVSDTTAYDPSWGDPQFLGKYAVSMTEDRIVSGTLGFSPHFSKSGGEIRSPRARFYPGLLVYQTVSDSIFVQAGTQVGVPIANGDIVTFDYGLSAGFWAYKACEGSGAWLTGIAPQVELYGQHAFWDNRIDGSVFDDGAVTVQQGRHVLDVTVGASVLLRGLLIGGGYSFPITGADARRSELIATVQYRF